MRSELRTIEYQTGEELAEAIERLSVAKCCSYVASGFNKETELFWLTYKRRLNDE